MMDRACIECLWVKLGVTFSFDKAGLRRGNGRDVEEDTAEVALRRHIVVMDRLLRCKGTFKLQEVLW